MGAVVNCAWIEKKEEGTVCNITKNPECLELYMEMSNWVLSSFQERDESQECIYKFYKYPQWTIHKVREKWGTKK